MKKIVSLLALMFVHLCTYAQKDTLPEFSVKNISGQIEISWHNVFKNAIQINIQRSKEPNKSFITIHSTPDPKAKQYRYTDKTAPHDSSYYRVFMLFEGTNYIFSKVIRPVVADATNNVVISAPRPEASEEKTTITTPQKVKKQIVFTLPADTVQAEDKSMTEKPIVASEKMKEKRNEEIILEIKHHSYSRKSKQNTLRFNLQPPPVLMATKTWAPSAYIFMGDDGNVTVRLPDISMKKYSVTFLKEEGRPLFVLDNITESPMTLDKSSFLKSGWYYFELREDGAVLERNKFLITRDN
jgi:hypothetical protein